MPPLIPTRQPSIVWSESFDRLDRSRWREVSLHRHTTYEQVTLDGRSCLKAHSQASASILLSAVQFDPDHYEWFSWSWRVDRLAEGEALQRKGGSDLAARVYVYFESKGLPWQKRHLDYIWSSSLPVGTVMDSAFSASSKLVVVESGSGALGRWRRVERNIEDDYRRAFGQDPPPVIAIGVMSDSDNAGSETLAYFDDLRISADREPMSP